MRKHHSPTGPVTACLLVQMCVGIIYLWSVFNLPVTEAFDMTNAAGSMVSSYMLFAFVLGCLVGGIINDHRGPRFTITIGVLLFGFGVGSTGILTRESAPLINVTYAMFGGLGSGFGYTACMNCIQKWFPTKRGFASGLAAAAFGFSTVVFTPLSRWLMDCFTDAGTGLVNFRPVFFLLGGLFLVLGLAASLFVHLPEADSPQALAAEQAGPGRTHSVYPDTLNAKMVVRTAPFWCIFFTIFFSASTWTLVLPMISSLGVMRGLSLTAATITVSFTGIVNTVGRLVLASLSDKIGRRATMTALSCLTIIGALLLTFIKGPGYICAIMLIAFAYGGPGPLAGTFAVDFFGAKNSARNFGLITLSLGFSSVVCNMISTWLLRGSEVATFIMAAAMAAVPIGLMILLRRYEETERARTESSTAIFDG